MGKLVMLTAEDVQDRLKLKSRAKALEVMTRLPHVNLAPRGAAKRNLRITEVTLEAFCSGKIDLSNSVDSNVLELSQERDHRREANAERTIPYRYGKG